MNIFEEKSRSFFEKLGEAKKMVLSTSLNDKVTSRMMSIIVNNGIFYFQTDVTFRKYEQLKNNANVALCIDNLQIEGICKEIGYPRDNPEFCTMYERNFRNSYNRYTMLENERLFAVKPEYIQLWIYDNGEPFVEIYDFKAKIFKKTAYKGE